MKEHSKKIINKQLIQLAESYNRSTNLELDFYSTSRLKNIYLSSKFQEGLKEVFASVLETNSKHRVRVLSGSPGLGKSTFALLTAQVFSKKYPSFVNSLISKADKKLQNDCKLFYKLKNTKLMPVFIDGYEGEIESVFKNNLEKALLKNKIHFKRPQKNTLQFYKDALKILKAKGYGGIFVIYDEFGKYLEKGVHNPTDLNLQFLQNFAEFCNRSGETQCHLMLITHLSVSQYAGRLPINVRREWVKIEGRFQESSFYDKNTDDYKMISAVFEKNISHTKPALAEKYKNYIKKYLSKFSEDAFEGFIDLKNIASVLMDCFPLHPVVLALLPHLSKKVAQNERTLYTFLTRDEEGSLKRFLEQRFKDHTTLLMPYDLYKYFKPLIGKDVGIGGTYKIQLMAEHAFKHTNKKDEVSKQIISLMALCSVIKDVHFAPLSEGFILSCFNQLYSKTSIKKSLTTLRRKKVIFYNKNMKQYLLQEGSPVDIDEEIAKLKNTTLTGKSLVQVLKRYFRTDFIIPKKYNFEKAITRFYRTQMICVEELKNLKKKQIIDFYKEDGLVFYVIPFSHDELVYAKSEICKIASPLTVFVLPRHFIECRKDIEELNAVDCLYNNEEILSAGPLVKKELDRHKEILLSSISALLKPLIGCMNLSAYIMCSTKPAKKISHFKELERFLGMLFEKEYNKYISFNLEYMNRHSVSGSITLGRKKFIDALRLYKTNFQGKIDNLIKGYGPDRVIFDTVKRLSNFEYDSATNTYKISSKSEYNRFFKEYKQILFNHPKGITGQRLLEILIRPPYGLRLGVIPVFTALADLCFKQPVSHYFDSAYVKDLDGDHYDLLMKYPKKTVIHYTAIDTKKQKFLDGLAEVFKADNMSVRSVISALVKWRKTIPESTKQAVSLSQMARKFLIQLDSSKQPDKLLFNDIPYCFEKKSITSKLSVKEIKSVLSNLKTAKTEIDEVYRKLLLRMEKDLINFASFINTECLRCEVTPNPLLKQELISVLSQVKDYPFSSHTGRFVGRVLNFPVSGYKQYFLETVGDVLTGSSPRYWDQKGYSKFEFALKRVQTEIELACEIATPQFKGQSILAFIDKGNNKKTFLKLGASFKMEKRLSLFLKKIQKMLDSFDETDKRKLTLALLEHINKNTSEKSKITIHENSISSKKTFKNNRENKSRLYDFSSRTRGNQVDQYVDKIPVRELETNV